MRQVHAVRGRWARESWESRGPLPFCGAGWRRRAATRRHLRAARGRARRGAASAPHASRAASVIDQRRQGRALATRPRGSAGVMAVLMVALARRDRYSARALRRPARGGARERGRTSGAGRRALPIPCRSSRGTGSADHTGTPIAGACVCPRISSSPFEASGGPLAPAGQTGSMLPPQRSSCGRLTATPQLMASAPDRRDLYRCP
jgi:hypothetical protein